MVHVPPCRGFGQEMCEKLIMCYASPDGGLDPIALELTDGPLCTNASIIQLGVD